MSEEQKDDSMMKVTLDEIIDYMKKNKSNVKKVRLGSQLWIAKPTIYKDGFCYNIYYRPLIKVGMEKAVISYPKISISSLLILEETLKEIKFLDDLE